MAGEAKTNAFMLSTATVMVGPTSDLFNLNPAAHSIGLVKNFQITAEPSYTELTQGVKNNIVYSVLTQNPVRCTMEAYEFTAKNLAYGVGLDGSSLSTVSVADVLKTQIAAAGTTAVISSVDDNSADYPVGSWIYIQEADGDKVHLSKVSAVSYDGGTDELTITLATATPTGVTYAVGSEVRRIHRINVGSKTEQPYLAAKIVGIMPDSNQPLVVLIPKMRIVRGFTLAFQSDNYGNLPLEFTPFELVASDTFYSEFNDGPVALFSGQ